MEILKIIRIFLSILYLLILISCRKDELNYELTSVFDESSQLELIVVDSLVPNQPGAANHFVHGYFYINYDVIEDTSLIRNVVIYETSNNGTQTYPLHPQQRNYFIDINVVGNKNYTFSLALADYNGKVSRSSKKYNVFVPN